MPAVFCAECRKPMPERGLDGGAGKAGEVATVDSRLGRAGLLSMAAPAGVGMPGGWALLGMPGCRLLFVGRTWTPVSLWPW